MPESVDPEKLVSLAKLAAEFGYNAEHLRQLAVQKRLRAWLISDAMWVTTRQNLVEYMDSRKPTGRRRAVELRRTSRRPRKN
jgi:hypothetical protein